MFLGVVTNVSCFICDTFFYSQVVIIILSVNFSCANLELPVKIIKSLDPVKTTVNERIELECEVSEEGAQVKW